MDSNKVSKLQCQLIEMEKQVFPNCIQVRHQYSNKRKSSRGPSLRMRRDSDLFELPGENIDPTLTGGTQKMSSSRKVENWLQQCAGDASASAARLPFSDLNPNQLSVSRIRDKTHSKMCLRSSKNHGYIENNSIKSNSSHVAGSNQNDFISTRHEQTLNHNKKVCKKKYLKNVSGNRKKNKVDQEVELLSISGSSHSNHVTIEDSDDSYVDKDRLACLAVEKEATLKEATSKEAFISCSRDDVLQFERHSALAERNSRDTFDNLQTDLVTQPESQQVMSPMIRYSAGREMVSTANARMDGSANNDASESKDAKNKTCSKTYQRYRLSLPRQMPRKKYIPKKRLSYLKAYTKNIRFKQHIFIDRKCKSVQTDVSKCTENKSVQTDLSIICNFVSVEPANQENESIEAHEKLNSRANSSEIITSVSIEKVENLSGAFENYCSENMFTEDCDNNEIIQYTVGRNTGNIQCRPNSPEIICTYDISNEKTQVIPTEEWIGPDSSEGAHNTSGSHTVHVLFHASMHTPPRNSESVIEGTPEKLSRTLHPSRSPSLVFDEEMPQRTPPHIRPLASPTFTSPTSNISNSSSNKENYDPNKSPLKEQKKTEKSHKGKEGTARSPFRVLFETSDIRVACCCLQPVQESLVMLACTRLGWTYCQEFQTDLTHLVVAVDKDKKAQRTERYVCALALGCWIVSYEWAVQSLTHECHQDEDYFDVLDVSGEMGPLLSRTSNTKLFAGLTFNCLDSITTFRRDILTWILEAAGGQVVSAAEAGGEHVITLHEPNEDDTPHSIPEGAAARAAVLNYTWVLESLGRYRRLAPRLFLLHAAEPHSLEGAAARAAVLNYTWVLESLGRYRRLAPRLFLLHAAEPHSLEGAAARAAVLNYTWVLESLGRYRRLAPRLFLLHAAEPHSLGWLHCVCEEDNSTQIT